MAALLVALAVMAILMAVAMPVWRQQAQREKEAELVFRGEQYARAIALYSFKNSQTGGRRPPCRRDRRPRRRAVPQEEIQGPDDQGRRVRCSLTRWAGGSRSAGAPHRRGSRERSLDGGGPLPDSGSLVIGGIIGVRSKSEETSLRMYRGQTRYDQWHFTFNTRQRPGGGNPDGRSG